MLSKMKMFAAAAVIAMAFVGCAKEETSMSINDLPGRAKVKGTVYYCEKQEHIEGTEMYKEVKVPKAGVKVFAEIDNASISGNEDTEGVTVIETKTDKQGYYELEIPVPEDGLEFHLEAQPFEGMKTLILGMSSADTIIFKDTTGVFKCETSKIELLPGDIAFKDFVYNFTPKAYTDLENKGYIPLKKTWLSIKVYVAKEDYSFRSLDTYYKDEPIQIDIKEDGEIIKSCMIYDYNNDVSIPHYINDFINGSRTLTISAKPYSSVFMNLKGSFRQLAERWDFNPNWENWKNNFKDMTITVSPFEDSREIKLYMLFDPIVTEEFDSEDYYQKWTNAYKEATSSFPY